MGEHRRDGSAAHGIGGPTPKIDALRAYCHEPFAYFLRGDTQAIDCALSLVSILHVWDDLIDHDRPLADEDVMAAFWTALVTLPGNPFYAAHTGTLQPILINAILNWRTANTLERHGTDHDATLAFVLRAAYIDLLSMSAWLVGGLAWAVEVGPLIARWAHDETYAEYLTHLQHEKEARACR